MAGKKSMLDVAYDIIKKSEKSVSFKKLWTDVCKELSIPEDQANAKISSFYTQLTTSGIIVQDKGNWNLASRVSYDQSHIAYDDSEDSEIEYESGEKELYENQDSNAERQEEGIDGNTDEEEKSSVDTPPLDDLI